VRRRVYNYTDTHKHTHTHIRMRELAPGRSVGSSGALFACMRACALTCTVGFSTQPCSARERKSRVLLRYLPFQH
jgi:hypothetical protein